MRLLLLASLVLIGGPAFAQNDCTAMLAGVGAPEYKGDAPEHEVLCRIGYVLSHNREERVPDWVLERLTPERFSGPADRKTLGNPFAPDPDLDADRRAELRDYKGSGFDRGHLAPAASMTRSDAEMTESFYLSNMAPQVGIGFNRHIWADLEKLTRTWTCDRGEVVVISGPVYGETPKKVKSGRVTIPSAFYKIAYDPKRKRAIAFLMPNRKIDKNGRTAWRTLKDYIVTVSEVEEQTGIDFLARLAARDERRIEHRKSYMWPDRGGCAATG